ncbi:MAG: alpha-glucan family phosphorylase [Acidobacteria bacterium]|nr:alpha-glucan family phosphorylase [Acidobacteriota bacterium]
MSESSPIPERIAGLHDLATDLWWVWHNDAREVFRRLDYKVWRLTAHNPVRMLPLVGADRFAEVAISPAFLQIYDEAMRQLAAARAGADTWWSGRTGIDRSRPIAYFSAEFALHQSLPIYAGGLGVLAGDHCKEASDLGLPFIGVGFMYPQGYFHQTITADGWQEEVYEQIDWAHTATQRAKGLDGQDLVIVVPLGNRTVQVSVWQVKLGGVSLYLMDTNLPENAPWDRELSARLYGGDRETRVQQEVILGIGGVRVLRALGVDPGVWHLNEGHAAFVVLQRIRELLEQGSSFADAHEEVRRSTVFTTHTPVPAGHDAFPFHMVETHLAGCWGGLGSHREDFLALGRFDNGHGTLFNMTALAMRSASGINAVSQLHGHVTRQMWAPLIDELPPQPEPVKAVTNGVHMTNWLSLELSRKLDQYLPADWRARHDETALWDAVLRIPDEELWETRERMRSYMYHFVRERIRDRWVRENATAARVLAGGTLLGQNALTIGFARRMTAYKRPDLIFKDPDRLARLLNDPRRPVQIVFAGKAHPADEGGKHALQGIYRRALDPRFGGRIAFVDDYDLHVAHYLVQGCDVWLNNPLKPLEASGTSGMKAAANGVLNVSIGDGWWPEGFVGGNGWLIDPGVDHTDRDAQDAADADALYRVLETEVVPAFYERDAQDIPRRWVRMVKESIRSVAPRFSTRRMLKEYVERMYLPAYEARTVRR